MQSIQRLGLVTQASAGKPKIFSTCLLVKVVRKSGNVARQRMARALSRTTAYSSRVLFTSLMSVWHTTTPRSGLGNGFTLSPNQNVWVGEGHAYCAWKCGA